MLGHTDLQEPGGRDPWGLGTSGASSPRPVELQHRGSTHFGLSPPRPQEFILSCLARDPSRRPSAHNLLFHRVLFEVHSLKLLAAHCFLQHQCEGQAGWGCTEGLAGGGGGGGT